MNVKNILRQYGDNEKRVSWFAWSIVVCSIVICLIRYRITSPDIFGDEGTYRTEAEYLANYGFYKALSQGTSFGYSCIIFSFSKIFHTNYLLSMRLLTLVFYLLSCRFLLKCLEQFKEVGFKERFFTLGFFAAISAGWLKEGLPDMIEVACLLGSMYLVLQSRSYVSLLLAAVILFAGFTCKPVVLFALPGFWLVLLLRDKGWLKNTGRLVVFTGVFLACFVAYHTPGYLTYHRLMTEDKDHYYENGVRIQNKTTWHERNVYFELYNPNHRPSQWHVTWDEVQTFQQQHPDVRLDLGPVDIMKQYPVLWVSRFANKVFAFLPYNVQRGFFFFWWTLLNRFLKSIVVIGILTSVLIFAVYICERKFIAVNALAFSIPLLYYLGLSFYIVTPLQGNWLLFCMAFFALPVCRFLARHINIIVLLALQLVFLFTQYNSI